MILCIEKYFENVLHKLAKLDSFLLNRHMLGCHPYILMVQSVIEVSKVINYIHFWSELRLTKSKLPLELLGIS